MTAPLTQRQVCIGRRLRIAEAVVLTCLASRTCRRQTLIKFAAFSVAIIVAPGLMQYRGLEGASLLRLLRDVRHGCGTAPQSAAVARRARFLADAERSSPAVLEAALGAPLVRQAENRVYASAALSFGTCMVVRASLRMTRSLRTSVLTLLALSTASSSSSLLSFQRCSSRGPLRRRRRRSEGLLVGDERATTR